MVKQPHTTKVGVTSMSKTRVIQSLLINDAFRRKFIYKADEEPELRPSVGWQLLITLPSLLFTLIVATSNVMVCDVSLCFLC